MTGSFQGRGGDNSFGCGSNSAFGKTSGFSNRKDLLDPSAVAVICQIYFKLKLTATECINRFNKEFINSYP